MSDTNAKLANHYIDDYLLRHMSPAQREQLLQKRAFEREREQLEEQLVADLQDQLLREIEARKAGLPYNPARIDELVAAIRKYRPADPAPQITQQQAQSKLDQYIKDFSGS